MMVSDEVHQVLHIGDEGVKSVIGGRREIK